MAAGPGIEPGRRNAPLAVVDVTPTILYSLGLPVPSDLEGKVPKDVFASALLRQRPVEIGPPTQRPDPFADRQESLEPAFAAEAEAEMVARLQALGYLE